MGCATSTFASRFSPRPLNFSWVTHSPGRVHPSSQDPVASDALGGKRAGHILGESCQGGRGALDAVVFQFFGPAPTPKIAAAKARACGAPDFASCRGKTEHASARAPSFFGLVGVVGTLEFAERVESWSGRRHAPYGASLVPVSKLLPCSSQVLLLQMTMLENRRAEGRTSSLSKRSKLCSNFNLFCLKQQYTYPVQSSLGLSKSTCALI
jgi:hypothetical protein